MGVSRHFSTEKYTQKDLILQKSLNPKFVDSFCKQYIMGISRYFDTQKTYLKTWYSSKCPNTSDRNLSIPLDQNVLIFLVAIRNIYNRNI